MKVEINSFDVFQWRKKKKFSKNKITQIMCKV